VPTGRKDNKGASIGANGTGRDGLRRLCFNPICRSPDHMLADQKCDQSAMPTYVRHRMARHPKHTQKIVFAYMSEMCGDDSATDEDFSYQAEQKVGMILMLKKP
jgi:hypothetical protein